MNNAVLGGLIGSTLTAIILRICDLVQKRLEHKYGLKKSYFERKLLIAEAAVTQTSIVISNLMSLSAMLDLIAKHPELLQSPPPEFLKNMTDNISQQASRLSAPALDIGRAAPLFFDQDDLQDHEAVTQLMELMLSVYSRVMLFQFVLSQLQSAKTPDQTTSMITTGREIIRDLQNDIVSLTAKIKAGYHQLQSYIAKLRTGMKKYDS